MIQRSARFVAAAAALALAGCAATTSPESDARFGRAQRALLSQQILDADAARRNGDKEPAADGRTVRAVADRTQSTYKTPPPPTNIVNIGIGSGGR